jgi:hypothetical protein
MTTCLLKMFFHPHDVEAIMSVRIPQLQAEDVIAWHRAKSVFFSVHSAYRLALNLSIEENGISQHARQ